MKKTLLIILFASTLAWGQNLNFDWAYTNQGNYGLAVATDDQNNAIFSGIYSGSIDLDPGPGTMIQQSEGDQDIYLQKMNPNGDLLWAKSFGGQQIDHIRDVIISSNNDVYLTGFFANTMAFPNTSIPALVSNGEQDVFIIKLDENGNLIWAKSFGGPGQDIGFGIALDEFGGIHIGGIFHDQVDFNVGPGNNPSTSAGLSDAFLLSLTTNGDYISHQTISSQEKVNLIGINCYADGSVAVAGHYFGSTTFDTGTTLTSTNDDSGDIYLARYSPSRQLQWVKSLHSNGQLSLSDIDLDPNDNAYIVGAFEDTIHFNAPLSDMRISEGGYDGFIQKYSPSGGILFTKNYGGPSDLAPTCVTANEFTFYVSGWFVGNADFDPSSDTDIRQSNGQADFYIQEFQPNGVLTLAETIGGPQTDYAYALGSSSDQGVYLTGIFNNTVDFDPGFSNQTYSTTSSSAEVFGVRYANCSDLNTQSITACDSYTWENGTTYQSSIYGPSRHFFNAEGCDSTVVLNLTVNYSEVSDQSMSACFEYTWIDGITYTESTDTPMVVLTTVAGCDSTVYLNLEITQIDTYIDGDDSTFVSFESDASYQWVNCTENYAIIPGAINDSFVTHSTDQFAVIIEKNGCLDTSACASLLQLDVDQINRDRFVLYPNPADEIVEISFAQEQASVQLEIVDVHGKTVFSIVQTDVQSLTLPLDLTNGVYFVNMTTSSSAVHTEKLVVQH